MKKFVALILAVVMVFALATSASAEDAHTDNITNISGNAEGIVHVTVSNDATPVYRVEVAWDSLNFTYSVGGWNTENHTYNAGTGWDKTSTTVTLTNHSNASVKYTATAEKTDDSAALAGVKLWVNAEDTLTVTNTLTAWGVSGNSATFNVVITGEPSVPSLVKTALGTVTVTISAAP